MAASSRPSRLKAVLLGAAGLVAVGAIGYLALPAQAQIAVRNQGYIPFSEEPINYRTREPADPVAQLQKDLEAGKVKLTYSEDHGYLKSVLKLLKIPISSQTLVFSKTSFQYPKISPEHPRALYYNDDVYVGSVHEGKEIEIVSFDPNQGAMFYLLDEKKSDKPAFERAELDCTQCHIAPGTRGIPGVLLRSIYPTTAGGLAPRAPLAITDQKTPLKERWGGWYVTGGLAGSSMANAVVSDAAAQAQLANAVAAGSGAQATRPPLSPLEGRLDIASYITATSDQVAHLVLAHQTQMHNLITLTNYQTRIGLYKLAQSSGAQAVADKAPSLDSLPEATRKQIETPAEQLIRYLLFVGETPLGGQDAKKAIAASKFAKDFAARGERDSKGRSLRDFDLHDRIFRYPCSYLIYNSAFDAIPEPAKGYIYHRLLQVLSGQDQSPDFAGLSADDRKAILSILLETKPGLPEEWRAYARSNRLRVAALPSSGRNN